MVLLRDVSQVDAHISPFGDSVNLRKIGARFASNIPWAQKSFWAHLMVLLRNVGQLEARLGPFGDNVNLDAR
jgi:hypothetical protein